MVYRGKPSKACLQCRRRKLRCDLRRESCSQCIRATLVCSGYRDTEQLRVRNETQSTRQKALSRTSRPIPHTLSTAIDDRARNAFFSHYVSGFSKTYDVLESLYKQSSTDGTLIASVNAVSLAFFSFQFDCMQAVPVSRERYLTALPLLNKALQRSESATSNSTLLSILLLDLYEKITNNNPRSISSWMSHINGALALVGLRDQPSLQDYTGRRLSARLSTNLLISCVSANSPLPPALVKLRSDLEPFLNRDDPKWQLSGLVVKYANLKGAIQDECFTGAETVARSMELDLEYMLFARNMPSTWLFSTIHLDEPSERVLENFYDTYPDHLTTQGWNVLRVMRILLNDTIRAAQISPPNSLFLPTNPSCYRSASIATAFIDSIAKEICASVPQFTTVYNKTMTTKAKSKIFSTCRKLQSYTLLFPLYVAGLYASPGTQIRPWIITQLHFMAHEMGIRNADAVAGILERDEGTCPWDVYAVLGSYAFAA